MSWMIYCYIYLSPYLYVYLFCMQWMAVGSKLERELQFPKVGGIMATKRKKEVHKFEACADVVDSIALHIETEQVRIAKLTDELYVQSYIHVYALLCDGNHVALLSAFILNCNSLEYIRDFVDRELIAYVYDEEEEEV